MVPVVATPERADASLVAAAGGLIGSRVLVAALGWTGSVLIARTLSIEQFGLFTLVFTVLGLMSIVTDMGMGRIVVAGLLDPDRDRAHFAGAYIVLRTAMGLVGYGAAVGFTVLAGYSGEIVRAMAVAGIVVLLATPSAALDGVYEAHLRVGRIAVADLVGGSTQLVLTAAIVAAGGTLMWLLLPALVAEVVMLAWKLVPLRRTAPIRYAVDLALWRAMLREALPLSLGIGLATVTYRIDTVLLSKLADLQSVAVYGTAYKFVDVLSFVPLALSTALLPVLVRHWPGHPEAFRATVRRAWTLLAMVLGLVLAEFTLFAGPLLTTLYGERYGQGATAARIVVAAQTLAGFTVVGLTVLIALGRHRVYPWVALVGLVLNVCANLVAIPRWGYEGSAVATLASDGVVLALMVVLLRRTRELRPMQAPPFLRVAVAVVTAGTAGWFVALVAPWPAAALVAAIAYAVVLFTTQAAGPGGLGALVAWPERAPKESNR